MDLKYDKLSSKNDGTSVCYEVIITFQNLKLIYFVFE